MSVRAGGELGVGDDLGEQVVVDLAVAEAIAVPLTLVLLLFAFGSVVAALLPLLVGGARGGRRASRCSSSSGR